MYERKRGQATVFVLVGIVIFVVVVLLLYLRGSLSFGTVTSETLQDRLTTIESHIKSCIQDIGDDPIRKIGLQGGYLSLAPETFRASGGVDISYLCYNRGNDPRCYNRMLTLGSMEEDISLAIQRGLGSCLNIKKFTRGLDATTGTGSPAVTTDIGQDTVSVLVTYPITLRKGELRAQEDQFTKTFSYPLGRLYQVSQDIITIESSAGDFDQLSYMLSHQGQFVIEKKKPYPDKLYILQTKDSDYLFQFFVQGEATT